MPDLDLPTGKVPQELAVADDVGDPPERAGWSVPGLDQALVLGVVW